MNLFGMNLTPASHPIRGTSRLAAKSKGMHVNVLETFNGEARYTVAFSFNNSNVGGRGQADTIEAAKVAAVESMARRIDQERRVLGNCVMPKWMPAELATIAASA
jgi:hypothetical protein